MYDEARSTRTGQKTLFPVAARDALLEFAERGAPTIAIVRNGFCLRIFREVL
jgi:hypothetical protein